MAPAPRSGCNPPGRPEWEGPELGAEVASALKSGRAFSVGGARARRLRLWTGSSPPGRRGRLLHRVSPLPLSLALERQFRVRTSALYISLSLHNVALWVVTVLRNSVRA